MASNFQLKKWKSVPLKSSLISSPNGQKKMLPERTGRFRFSALVPVVRVIEMLIALTSLQPGSEPDIIDRKTS